MAETCSSVETKLFAVAGQKISVYLQVFRQAEGSNVNRLVSILSVQTVLEKCKDVRDITEHTRYRLT